MPLGLVTITYFLLERPVGRDRVFRPLPEDCPKDLAQLCVRLHLQPHRDPPGCRALFPLGFQAPAVDGLGRHGLELGLCRGLVAAAEALQEADPSEAGDRGVPEGHGGQVRSLRP